MPKVWWNIQHTIYNMQAGYACLQKYVPISCIEVKLSTCVCVCIYVYQPAMQRQVATQQGGKSTYANLKGNAKGSTKRTVPLSFPTRRREGKWWYILVSTTGKSGAMVLPPAEDASRQVCSELFTGRRPSDASLIGPNPLQWNPVGIYNKNNPSWVNLASASVGGEPTCFLLMYFPS